MLRLLVVNADDFGFTEDVNEGIIEAHKNGIVTATTLMANGEAFEHAVRLARQTPTLDFGCHLVLIGGRSLLPPHDLLPATVAEFTRCVYTGRIRLYEELAAQVRRIQAAGLNPTHLDTHKHTHVLPPVLRAVVRLAGEFGIRWVRRPVGFPFESKFRRLLSSHGCRATDHFAGFQLTGRLGKAELAEVIRGLRPGTTELMCHPGRCGSELRRAPTRLKESRERELEALTAPEIKELLTEEGVRLVPFRALPMGK